MNQLIKWSGLMMVICLLLSSCSNGDNDVFSEAERVTFNKGLDQLIEWNQKVTADSKMKVRDFYAEALLNYTFSFSGRQNQEDPDLVKPFLREIGLFSSIRLHDWLVEYGLEIRDHFMQSEFQTKDEYLQTLTISVLNEQGNFSTCLSEVMTIFLTKALSRAESFGLNTIAPEGSQAAFVLDDDPYQLGSSVHKVFTTLTSYSNCN